MFYQPTVSRSLEYRIVVVVVVEIGMGRRGVFAIASFWSPRINRRRTQGFLNRLSLQ